MSINIITSQAAFKAIIIKSLRDLADEMEADETVRVESGPSASFGKTVSGTNHIIFEDGYYRINFMRTGGEKKNVGILDNNIGILVKNPTA